MKINSFDVAGPLLLTPKRHGDARGLFSEVFRQDQFEAAAGPTRFVQDNHLRSGQKGVIHGLHYQAPPAEQGKLVRVSRGAVWDVLMDARRGSPTYGRYLGVELSEGNWRQFRAPPGSCTASAP